MHTSRDKHHACMGMRQDGRRCGLPQTSVLIVRLLSTRNRRRIGIVVVYILSHMVTSYLYGVLLIIIDFLFTLIIMRTYDKIFIPFIGSDASVTRQDTSWRPKHQSATLPVMPIIISSDTTGTTTTAYQTSHDLGRIHIFLSYDTVLD